MFPEDPQVLSDHDLQQALEVQWDLVFQNLPVVLYHLLVQLVRPVLENLMLLKTLVDRAVPLNPEAQSNPGPRLVPGNPRHPSAPVLLCRPPDQLIRGSQHHPADQDLLLLLEYQLHQRVRLVLLVQMDQAIQLDLWVLCHLAVPQVQ